MTGPSYVSGLCMNFERIRLLCDLCFVTTAEKCHQGISHLCYFCCECCCYNFATEVSELSLKPYHIVCCLLNWATLCWLLRKVKEGSFVKLRQLGNWEGILQFSTRESYFFVSRRHNVKLSSNVFYAVRFLHLNGEPPFKIHHVEATWTIPNPG